MNAYFYNLHIHILSRASPSTIIHKHSTIVNSICNYVLIEYTYNIFYQKEK